MTKRSVLSLGTRVLSLTAEVRNLQVRVMAMEHRFAALETRFTAMEARLSGIEGRLGGLEERISAMLSLVVHCGAPRRWKSLISSGGGVDAAASVAGDAPTRTHPPGWSDKNLPAPQ